MSLMIRFTYVFDELLDRVYKCFSNYSIATEVVYSKFMRNSRKLKGENFDEEGAEFEFLWKDYYDFGITVKDVTWTDTFRQYSHKIKDNLHIPCSFTIRYSFFSDTCGNTTVFCLDEIYDNSFFTDLIKDEWTDKEKEKFCENADTFLKNTHAGLSQNQGTIINGNTWQVWDWVSDFNTIARIYKDIVRVKVMWHGDFRLIGTLFDWVSLDNGKVWGTFKIKFLRMSYDKMEVVVVKNNTEQVLPRLSCRICINKLNDKTCFLCVQQVMLDYLSIEALLYIGKSTKRVVKLVKEYFA